MSSCTRRGSNVWLYCAKPRHRGEGIGDIAIHNRPADWYTMAVSRMSESGGIRGVFAYPGFGGLLPRRIIATFGGHEVTPQRAQPDIGIPGTRQSRVVPRRGGTIRSGEYGQMPHSRALKVAGNSCPSPSPIFVPLVAACDVSGAAAFRPAPGSRLWVESGHRRGSAGWSNETAVMTGFTG
jgi:hypothetical protein